VLFRSIVRPIGDRIALAPPLIITTAEIDEMFDRLERALDDIEAVIAEKGFAA
jgi:4-aminobutyrate--pyruvate transaminase